jgi:REP element-mobilizing transposase RayT
MAGTYSQIYIQIVFAVQGRQNLLQKEWRQEVFKYMAGIIKNKGQKPIIVNGVEDHVHVFIGLKPAMAISDLARDVKNNSSNFINDHAWIGGRFNWQEGYGAFSYGHSQIEAVYHYIQTRSSITPGKPSRTNTWNFSKNSRSNMTSNTCLSGSNDSLDNPHPLG